MALPLIPLAVQLAAQFVPELIGKIAGKNAEAVAGKVVEVAQQVTGAKSGDDALAALQANAGLALKFKEAVLAQEVELEKLAAGNAAEVNATMRAEAAAEHWPTYSWRPAIGFAVALNLILSGCTVFAAYIGAMWFGKAEPLAHLPAMLGAMAALVGMAAPILGIASWFRGKMQADPSVPTVNRG
jgi:hypothetical protein